MLLPEQLPWGSPDHLCGFLIMLMHKMPACSVGREQSWRRMHPAHVPLIVHASPVRCGASQGGRSAKVQVQKCARQSWPLRFCSQVAKFATGDGSSAVNATRVEHSWSAASRGRTQLLLRVPTIPRALENEVDLRHRRAPAPAVVYTRLSYLGPEIQASLLRWL